MTDEMTGTFTPPVRRRRRRRKSYKPFLLLVALLLIIGGMIGGTLAWLLDRTEPVQNTFSPSTIAITLTESEIPDDPKDDTDGDPVDPNDPNRNGYRMVPGLALKKDPTVTVEAGSEDCWLFVAVEESTDPKLSDYIKYQVDSGWTKGNGTDVPQNVYYRRVYRSSEDQDFAILGPGSYKDTSENITEIDGFTYKWTENQVLVSPNVTMEMMEQITGDSAPKPALNFQAYAFQLYQTNDKEFEEKTAWENASSLDTQ